MKMIAGINLGLSGQIQLSVVEQGKVVRQFPVQRNLILNQGLDQIASQIINTCWQYGVAGTGVTATEVDSATDTATIAIGAVTLSTTGYLAGNSTDVGKTIKLDTSGNNYLITAFGDTTHCTVTPNDTIGPDTFIIYNTNQTQLATEVKRTNTYLTGIPDCQCVTIGNTTTNTRTFDFSAEAGPVTYNEIGFSPTVSVGANLFSRIKLPTGVPLIAGQQLRVKYSVATACTPITPQTYGSSPIIGWPTATGRLQLCTIPIYYVSSTGYGGNAGNNPVDGKYYGSNAEPSGTGGAYSFFYLSTDATAFPTYGVNPGILGTHVELAWALSTYVNGTYTRDKIITFPVGSANRTDWRSFFLGENNYGYCGPKFIFDSNQTKLSTYTLTLGFRSTWDRVL